jgi:hypothetical protein
MSSITPSADNGYLIPPDFALSRVNLQALFTSIHERIAAREALEAAFAQLIAQGTGQALDVIEANVAPQLMALATQIATLDAQVTAAQDAIATLLNGQLSASNVTQTTDRRFVPAYSGAQRRVLASSAAGLAWLTEIAIASNGRVGFPQGVDVPWGDVQDRPASFPPSAHEHSISDVNGLPAALSGLSATTALKEPALPPAPADPEGSYLRGDRTWAATPQGVEKTPGAAPFFGARAFVNFDGLSTPPAIRQSGNVSSVVRNAAGDYTVNFLTPLPDAGYAAIGAASIDVGNVSFVSVPRNSDQQAGSVRIMTVTNGLPANVGHVSLAVFR